MKTQHIRQVGFKPSFIRQYKKLSSELKEEINTAIGKFRANPEDPSLKTHKLQGKLQGRFSFSVNYKYRIVFRKEASGICSMLAVGDHDVYRT